LRYDLDIRCGLLIRCSISQNIQTKAAPKATTIQIKSNVNAGAVSMFNIPDAMQTAHQRMESNTASVMETPRSRFKSPLLVLEVLDAFGVGSLRIPRQV